MAFGQRRAVKACSTISIGERCFDRSSTASRILRISPANSPRFSENRPTPLPASARFFPALPTPLPTPSFRGFRPELRFAPRAKPPASPASAAPPAMAGPFSLPAAVETALAPLCAPSPTASLPFEAICLIESAGAAAPELRDCLRLLELVRERPLREAPDLDRPDDAVDRLAPFERPVFRRLACELFLVLVWAIAGPPFASVRIPLSAPFTRICWDKPRCAKGFPHQRSGEIRVTRATEWRPDGKEGEGRDDPRREVRRRERHRARRCQAAGGARGRRNADLR